MLAILISIESTTRIGPVHNPPSLSRLAITPIFSSNRQKQLPTLAGWGHGPVLVDIIRGSDRPWES